MNRREQIARIVDPRSWAMWPDNGNFSPSDRLAGQTRVRAESLAKADQIMALEGEAEARATRAEALLEEAREVLGPFAEAADNAEPINFDRDHLWETPEAMMLTYGHLRAARAFLDKLKPADTPPPVTATDTGRNT